MAYKVKLPIFEGPFDLLLYLIRKNEVDIYDIPIAEITHQYLEYLNLMKLMDLEIAGEFIEMVATLMLIKVRMLLPDHTATADEEPEDPRAKLVAQLLEYRRVKDAAEKMADLEHDRRQHYKRVVPVSVKKTEVSEADKELSDVSLFDLLTAFKTALDNRPKATVHQVTAIKITIENQVQIIFEKLEGKPYLLFRELAAAVKNKLELIVTFMALLDLIRLQFLAAKQSHAFGEIRLVPLNSLDMELYLELRDKELMPETVNGQ
jgi:segregation and condensation protein A